MKYFTLLFVLLNLPCTGQYLDSIIAIEEVTIRDSLKRGEDQLKAITGVDFTRALARESSVFVKNYGPSSIATLSYLGSNASQVSILWNGIPINNPMLGLNDVSLVNTFFFNNFKFNQADVHSIAAGLELSNEKEDFQFLQVFNSVGSFRSRKHGVKAKLSNKFVQSRIGIYRENSLNDFSYRSSSQGKRKTENAAKKQNAIHIQSLLKWSNRINSYIEYWWQDTYREIPKTTVQTISEANQKDESHRLFISTKLDYKMWKWKVSSGFIRERVLYKDPIIDLTSDGVFKSWLIKKEVERILENGLLKWSTSYTLTEGQINAYGNDRKIYPLNSQLMGFWNIGNLSVNPQIGMKSNTWEQIRWVGGSKATYSFGMMTLQAHLLRKVRFPSMNDLYWIPGGNPKLNEEKGWSQGLKITTTQSNYSVNLDFFHRYIKDWILWARLPDQVFFSASNVAVVQSYGMLVGGSYKHCFNDISMELVGKYVITQSRNRVEVALPKIEKGEQLLYTPQFKSDNNLTIDWNAFSFRCDHSYVSSSEGILYKLDGYHLFDISLAWKRKWKDFAPTFRLDLNNLLHTNYQIIENRPMPGRHFAFNFIINI